MAFYGGWGGRDRCGGRGGCDDGILRLEVGTKQARVQGLGFHISVFECFFHDKE